MALTREQTVTLARSQIGVREYPPGSNRVLYSLWYGFVAAWCAMFVSWVMAKAGIGWYRFASTAASVSAARRAGRLVPVPDALPGDVMVHLYSSTLGHTGIATTRGGTSTVEGNTDGGGSRTGGQVLEHARPAGYWHYCIRLDYPPAPAPPPPQEDDTMALSDAQAASLVANSEATKNYMVLIAKLLGEINENLKARPA